MGNYQSLKKYLLPIALTGCVAFDAYQCGELKSEKEMKRSCEEVVTLCEEHSVRSKHLDDLLKGQVNRCEEELAREKQNSDSLSRIIKAYEDTYKPFKK